MRVCLDDLDSPPSPKRSICLFSERRVLMRLDVSEQRVFKVIHSVLLEQLMIRFQSEAVSCLVTVWNSTLKSKASILLPQSFLFIQGPPRAGLGWVRVSFVYTCYTASKYGTLIRQSVFVASFKCRLESSSAVNQTPPKVWRKSLHSVSR